MPTYRSHAPLKALWLFLTIAAVVPAADRPAPAFRVRRGVNISHWLSQSGARGERRRSYFTEDDVAAIAEFGYDHIRLPVDEEQLWTAAGPKEAEAFGLLHHAMSWTAKYDLRVVVDLHILRSHHFNAREKPLWTDPAAQEKFLKLWRDLSAELKHYPVERVAYELMNEPVADDPDDWNELVAKTVAEIRKTEPDRILVIGSNRWQSVNTFDTLRIPRGDRNILLSFHFYLPMLLTHHQASWTGVGRYKGPVTYPGRLVAAEDMRALPADIGRMVKRSNGIYNRAVLEKLLDKPLRFSRQHELPLYCGEWGCITKAPRAARLAWYEDVRHILEKHGIGWANWDYRGGFGILDRRRRPDKELIEVLVGNRENQAVGPSDRWWADVTQGGAGGRVIRVTTLRAEGPGSFAEAVAAQGPRTVVFEVGGVIDLRRRSVVITEPFLTVAGQTAPSPGITLIRGGLAIMTHDVILQHVRVRPGEAGAAKKSGWEVDAIATSGGDAYNVVIDHCSCSWATDENLSASGPRFEGASVADWRRGTSRRIVFSNCLVAEGLSRSTHGKGGHSKGSLIHDNATEIAIVGNLYAHNVDRNPLFKGGARGAVVNNYVYNPGRAVMAYALVSREWGNRPPVTGQMTIVGNVVRFGPDTRANLPLLAVRGACDVYVQDNTVATATGEIPASVRGDCTRCDKAPWWPPGLKAMPAHAVRKHVLATAGARPWDRDAVDARIVREATEGTGKIIDSEQEVGGYPAAPETRATFLPDAWDLRTMTRRDRLLTR
jgi:pectate lyase